MSANRKRHAVFLGALLLLLSFLAALLRVDRTVPNAGKSSAGSVTETSSLQAGHEFAAAGPPVSTSRATANARPNFYRPWSGRRAPLQRPQETPATSSLFVEWHGRWYRAEVLNKHGDMTFIHYTGHGPEWDEWVLADRMRMFTDAELPEGREQMVVSLGENEMTRWAIHSLAFDASGELGAARKFLLDSGLVLSTNDTDAKVRVLLSEALTGEIIPISLDEAKPVVHGWPKQGDLLVEWGKQWWPAEILKSENDRHLIHYTGYGAEWDEWIGLDRMGTYTGAQP